MAESHDGLGAELERFGSSGRVFAVVDAACFDYLQDTLTGQRLRFDPLYLDEVDNPTIASGPHLVHLGGPRHIAKLRAVIGEAAACVWWVWPETREAGTAIHRHLRKLSMVEIPQDRVDAVTKRDAEGNEQPLDRGYEPVLFRHGDPNVVAMLLPLLEAPQVARVFGGARAIIVDAPDVCGVRAFEAPADLPEAPRGLLRIERGAQYQAVMDGYTDTLRNRAVREFGDRTKANPQQIESAFDRADRYGFSSKELIWEFIDLDIEHGARFEDSERGADLRRILSADKPGGYRKMHNLKALLRSGD